MGRVYVLQHVHESADGGEDIKLIGVYSSREKAQAAVARLCQTPGFRDEPAGFSIDEYGVDQDHWVEGYSTVAAS